MDKRVQANQGGSVINFLIVGIVLAGLVAAGVYVVHHRGEDKAASPSGTVAVSPSASPSASPSSSPSPSVSVKPSSSPKPSASPTQSASPAPTDVPTTGVDNLPATGPSDMLLSAFPAALLIGVSIAYVQSRRFRDQTTS